jgi:H-NS histone C-terminal domain
VLDVIPELVRAAGPRSAPIGTQSIGHFMFDFNLLRHVQQVQPRCDGSPAHRSRPARAPGSCVRHHCVDTHTPTELRLALTQTWNTARAAIASKADADHARGGRIAIYGRKSLKGRKVPVKYRDKHGNTWSGRGAQPRWMTAAIKAGAKRDDFLVDKPAKRATRKKSRRKK